jgi:dTMP kinase
VVLADRYIYTLMARDIVRGSSMEWLKEIYGFALEPDAVFYLNVTPKILAERHFSKSGLLDYWESGMDVQRAGGMYDNFIRYQTKLHRVFENMQKEYKFTTIQGNRRPASIHKEIREKVERILADRSTRFKGIEKTYLPESSEADAAARAILAPGTPEGKN